MKITDWIRQHQVAVFFILTYLISWLVWIPVALFIPSEESFHPLNFLGGFGPFLSALVVTWIAETGPGLRQWLKTIFKFRIGWRWHLLAWFVFPLIVALFQFSLYLLFGGKSDFSEAQSWYLYLLNVPITALFAGGNEEPGWRGFALPKMLRKQTPITASLIIGVLWAGWHLPLFFTSGWSGQGSSIIWFVINVVGLSFIMTWLFNKSSLSVIPVMLFHQATNHIWNYFPMPTDVLQGLDDFIVLKSIVYWSIAIVLLIATQGKLGYLPERGKEKGML
jgi:membrane protease YdiL (CAAX protease family)